MGGKKKFLNIQRHPGQGHMQMNKWITPGIQNKEEG